MALSFRPRGKNIQSLVEGIYCSPRYKDYDKVNGEIVYYNLSLDCELL